MPEPLFAEFEDVIARPTYDELPTFEHDTPDGEFVLEAPSVEAAIADVQDRTGRAPEVVEVETFTRGGIGGFFAREMVRVRVRVTPTTEATPHAPDKASGKTSMKPSTEARPMGVDGVLAALADATDNQERTFEAELRAALADGRSVRPADLSPAPVVPRVAAAPASAPIAPATVAAAPVAAAPVVESVAFAPVAPVVSEPVAAPVEMLEEAEPVVAEPVVEPVVEFVVETVVEEALVGEAVIEEAVVEATPRPLIADAVRARIQGETAPAVKMSSRVAQQAAQAQVAAAAPTSEALVTEAPRAQVATRTVDARSARAGERGRRLASGSPIAASRALRPGHRWTPQALYGVGLPASLIDRLDVPIGADEFTWLRAMAEAVAPWCRRLPSGSSVLVGPEADAVGRALGLATCQQGERPPYGGDVALAADDSVSGRSWVDEVRGERWVHLVAGGRRWEGLLAAEPRAVSVVGRQGIANALSLCAEFDLVLGHLMDDPTSHRAIRMTPLDVATAVRDLLPRAEGR